VDGVRVGEEQPVSRSGLRELVAGPVLASPALGKRGAGEEAMPGITGDEAGDDGGGEIGRSIVENKELEVRVVLGEEGRNANGYGTFLVSGGDEDRDASVGDGGASAGEGAEEEEIEAQSKKTGAQDAEDEGVEEEHSGVR
jgi:hypothetical protein